MDAADEKINILAYQVCDSYEDDAHMQDGLWEIKELAERLFSKNATDTSSDESHVVEDEMKLPDWYDDKKFKQGQRFFWKNCFGMSMSWILGLISVLSVPSILTILVKSRRSCSALTSYRRYLSTLLHVLYWVTYDLRPGTLSWKSLYTVRTRHFKAGRAAQVKGYGNVNQRDIAITLHGFVGFIYLKPDKFGITQGDDGDWEALNHMWAVFAHMLGLQDKYNICLLSFEGTREICKIIQDRVYTPCLENPPEYFEHMSRVMVEGLANIYPSVEGTSMLYLTKNLSNVPGYVYTESERRNFEERLKVEVGKQGLAQNSGVESSTLIEKPAVEGLPQRKSHLLYPSDYISIETAPAYKNLPFIGKYKLVVVSLIIGFYTTDIGHFIMNSYFKILIFISTYIPFMASFRFGIKYAFMDAFREDITDDTIPKANEEYNKPHPPDAWYQKLLAILW